jgi:hypothetical protein
MKQTTARDHLLKWFFIFSALLLMARPVGAQPGEDPQFQEKQERLQTLITVRLSDELGLSSEQSAKVAGILKKYHLKRRELRKKMMDLHQQLPTVAGSNDAKQASQVVSEIQKTREEIRGLDDAQFKELKPLLSPQQQAKFILVMDDIRREIMQFRRTPGGKEGPGGPTSRPAH